MAPMNIVPLNETAQGVAFEVEVKSPGGANIMTPVRTRLEAQSDALPRLLQRAKPETPPTSPVKDVAERARARNVKKAETVALFKQTCEELSEARRSNLEQACQQASEKRDAALAERRAQAAKHVEDAKAKACEHQRKQTEQVAEQQRQLEDAASSSEKARKAALELIRGKAGKHFEEALAKGKTFQAKTAEATAEQGAKLEQTLAQAYQQRQKTLEEKRTKAGKHFEEALLKAGEGQNRLRKNKLEDSLATADEHRAASLAARKETAGKHFNDAVAKGKRCRRERQAAFVARQRQLAKAFAQKCACQIRRVGEFRARAARHNELVVQKVQTHKQDVQQRVEALRARLQEKAQRQPIRCGGGGPSVVAPR